MQTDELLKLDNQLCFALYATNRAMTKAYKPLLDPFNLTYPQYLVLLVLYETDGIGVKTLGERLFLDSGTLTPLLKRMEASKLLSRERSENDERKVIITLTTHGKQLKEELIKVPLSLCKNYPFDTEGIQSLKQNLMTLLDALHE